MPLGDYRIYEYIDRGVQERDTEMYTFYDAYAQIGTNIYPASHGVDGNGDSYFSITITEDIAELLNAGGKLVLHVQNRPKLKASDLTITKAIENKPAETPLDGYKITLTGPLGSKSPATYTATSNAAGKFVFSPALPEYLDLGDYRISEAANSRHELTGATLNGEALGLNDDGDLILHLTEDLLGGNIALELVNASNFKTEESLVAEKMLYNTKGELIDIPTGVEFKLSITGPVGSGIEGYSLADSTTGGWFLLDDLPRRLPYGTYTLDETDNDEGYGYRLYNMEVRYLKENGQAYGNPIVFEYGQAPYFTIDNNYGAPNGYSKIEITDETSMKTR